jgi:hypothetical protein
MIRHSYPTGLLDAWIEGTLDDSQLPHLESDAAVTWAAWQSSAAATAAMGIPESLDCHLLTQAPGGQLFRTRYHAPLELVGPDPRPTSVSEKTRIYLAVPQPGYDYNTGEMVSFVYCPDEPRDLLHAEYDRVRRSWLSQTVTPADLAAILGRYWGTSAVRTFSIPELGSVTFTAETLGFLYAGGEAVVPFGEPVPPGTFFPTALNGTYQWLSLGPGVGQAWPNSYVAEHRADGPEDRIDPPAPAMPSFDPLPWPQQFV